MKVLIVSYFFEPEITPRGYRTAELAKALARRGHDVTVVLPNKEIFHRQPFQYKGVTILFGDGPVISGGPNQKTGSIRKRMPEWLVKLVLYFYNHEYFAKYDKGILHRLETIECDFDLLLSISYPVAVHRAVMNAFKKNKKLTARVKLAEFSDPPMRGEYNSGYLPWYDRIMHRAAKFFDRILIPVENALPVYLKFIPRDRVSVIPQGFDNSGIKIQRYEPHERPTFAFAGRFYRNTRDPEPLLKYLATDGGDFRFDIYLLPSEEWVHEMLRKYNSLSKGEIVIHEPLPRNELIGRLSTADFLINHNFNYSTATPSKLIDYSLTGRPVYSFSSDAFDPNIFELFLNGDYTYATPLPDPSAYDIDNIAGQMERFL